MKLAANEFISTRFIERPNRFILRLQFPGGDINDCHLQDPGRLSGLLSPGAEVLVKKVTRPGRKTRFSALLIRRGNTWVSVNSNLANELFQEGVQEGLFPFFKNAEIVKREYNFGKHRFDFLLQKDSEKWIVEVKSVTLVKGGVAYFPDAVTKRGKDHVEYLTALWQKGQKVALTFIVQREDAHSFSPDWDVDPLFSLALKHAHELQLPIMAFKYTVSPHEIKYAGILPLSISHNRISCSD